MVMVLRSKSKSPIHHVREGGVNGNRGEKLTGFPRRGKAAPFYPRQLTSKGASPRPQLSTPPHSILRVARVHVKARRRVECSLSGLMSGFFLSPVSGSPSTVAVVCKSSLNALFFFSSSFSRRLFRSAGAEHPRMRNRPPHSVVPLLRRSLVQAHCSMQRLLQRAIWGCAVVVLGFSAASRKRPCSVPRDGTQLRADDECGTRRGRMVAAPWLRPQQRNSCSVR